MGGRRSEDGAQRFTPTSVVGAGSAVAAMMIVKGTESSAYVPFILSLYGWVCSPLVLGRSRFGNPESMAPGANCYPCWSRWDRTT